MNEAVGSTGSIARRGETSATADVLHDAWRQTVHANPAAPALMDAAQGRIWTREEIDTAASIWAAKHGEALRGMTVALAEPNGAEWLQVFLGLAKSRAVILPLDPGDPREVQRATAAAVGATFLWREHALEPLAVGRRPRRHAGRLIKLTSGSTGAPRALIFTDRELMADGRQVSAAMGIRPEDINLGLIPWGHSYGLGNLILPLLQQGTAIVFGAAPLPHAIATAIQTWRPTVFPAVPALLRALAEAAIPVETLASLRTIISAGAPLAIEVAQAFATRFQRNVHSFYGSSETGGISFDRTGDSAASGRGVGQLIPGVTVEFQRSGRFTVTSPAVFSIGNRRPGTHRMADIARLEPSGELVLLGRAGRFVKIAGRRLNLAEVEQALKQVPGVKDALVTPHAERADALAAALATTCNSSEIRRELRTRLAPWKIPKRMLILPEFPLTSRGKTDTRRLRVLLNATAVAE